MAVSTGTTRMIPTLTQNGVFYQMENMEGTQKYTTVAGMLLFNRLISIFKTLNEVK